MMGLSGLLFTSMTGENTMWMPAARVSTRTASSIAARRSASFFELRPIAAATARWLGNRVPPASCWPSPRSTSDEIRSGSSAFAWRPEICRGDDAMSPPKRMNPPSPSATSLSISARYAGSSRRSPWIRGITIWATLRRTVPFFMAPFSLFLLVDASFFSLSLTLNRVQDILEIVS